MSQSTVVPRKTQVPSEGSSPRPRRHRLDQSSPALSQEQAARSAEILRQKIADESEPQRVRDACDAHLANLLERFPLLCDAVEK